MQVFIAKIEGEAKSVISTLSPLTKSPISEVIMAKQSLPFSIQSKQTCSISECERSAHTKGFCKLHYDRQLRGREIFAPLRYSVPRLCEVDGCLKKHHGKGKCREHFEAAHIANRLPKPRPILAERFWAVIDKDGPVQPHMNTSCWLFTGKSENNGYGVVGVGKKNHVAHHVSWFLAFGEWPLFLRHACDIRRCVNTDHLSKGDHQSNANDRVERDRSAKGAKHGRARLTETDIPIIDSLYWEFAMSCLQISRLFDVSRGSIQHAICRRNWRHIPKW